MKCMVCKKTINEETIRKPEEKLYCRDCLFVLKMGENYFYSIENYMIEGILSAFRGIYPKKLRKSYRKCRHCYICGKSPTYYSFKGVTYIFYLCKRCGEFSLHLKTIMHKRTVNMYDFLLHVKNQRQRFLENEM
nr:MAG: hypothetical protein [Lokiarchaeota virus Fenrir Meg22_1012]URC17296.1 MAG: hypothetical protein [Lokiarchaeota virus Fenrir Meg22_1214]